MEIVGRKTQFEAIVLAPAGKKIIMPNSPDKDNRAVKNFNRLLLDKGKNGNFLPIPEDILAVRYWFTGTAYAAEAIGKPFGKTIEKEFNYDGTKKTAVLEIPNDYQGGRKTDRILICKPDTLNVANSLVLKDSKTGKVIANIDELGAVDEYLVSFNGAVVASKLTDRGGGNFEKYKGETTNIWAADGSAFGLFWRGDNYLGYDDRRDVGANVSLGYRGGVLFLVSAKERLKEITNEVQGLLAEGVGVSEIIAREAGNFTKAMQRF